MRCQSCWPTASRWTMWCCSPPQVVFRMSDFRPAPRGGDHPRGCVSQVFSTTLGGSRRNGLASCNTEGILSESGIVTCHVRLAVHPRAKMCPECKGGGAVLKGGNGVGGWGGDHGHAFGESRCCSECKLERHMRRGRREVSPCCKAARSRGLYNG